MKIEDYAWIAQETEAIYGQLVAWRRHFHQHPELSFQEFQTGEMIRQVLEDLGAQVHTVAPTGVVGLLPGARAGPTVAIRADMDALPIGEETGRAYASRHPGVMHACGHDAHMAIALGTALLLAKNKKRWQGSVKFIFQPGEECPPGGAQQMIKAGVLRNPAVQALLGLHVYPWLPVGKVGLKEGTVMAADDNFKLTFLGEKSHGAAPHQGVDAIVVAAQAVLALQTIASRMVDPLEPVVLTIGTIHGGDRRNVIASRVELEGTVRTLSQQTREKMPYLIRQVLDGVTAGFGAAYELDYQMGYPPTVNDPQLVAFLRDVLAQELGADNVVSLTNPSMGGEDFAYFAQHVPSVFFLLGVGQGTNPVYPWHHAKFDIEEEALKFGVRLMARSALELLAK